MSFQIKIDFAQVNNFLDNFNAAIWGGQKGKLLDRLGNLVVEQTKERIDTEKTAPDGSAWAATQQNNPVLYKEGDLHDSIMHEVMMGSVDIGSPLVYAAIHQFGGTAGRSHTTEITARPFVGLSSENEREIEDELNDWMKAVFK